MSAILRGPGRRAFRATAASSPIAARSALCLAFLLALLGAAPARAQIAYTAGPVDLGPVNIGATPATATLTFNVPAGQTATVTGVSAVSLGSILQDFNVTAQTCTGATLTGPTSCTVTVAFSPAGRGLRRGAVVLTANNQANLAAYLHGVGVGSQLVFSPDTASSTGTVTPLQPVYYSPSSLVFDAAGNLFFNDFLNNRILEQSASGTLATVVPLPGSISSALALSGDGTLFITVPSQAAVYAVTPGFAPSKTLLTFTGATLISPSGIAVDADNSLYIADSAANQILHATTAGAATVLPLTGLTQPLSNPQGLALDGNGNLYIADTGNERIVRVVLATGAAAPVAITGASLFNPYGVTLDAAGTLYIADTGNRRIVRVLPSGAGGAVLISNFTFSAPTGVVLAANGDLVVADNNSGLTRIFRTSPTPTITFPTPTPVGTLDSADGTLSVALQNIGNAPLQIVVPNLTNVNPKTTNTAFAVAPTSTCPLTTSATPAAAAQIAAGTVCTYGVTFTPTVSGLNTGQLNLITRPTGANSNVTSSVTLNGTGTGTTTPPSNIDSFTITAPPTAIVGTPISFTVTAVLKGAVVPGYTGTITLATNDATAVFNGGTTYTFTAADAGSHTFTAPAAGLSFGTPGTFQIRATDTGRFTGLSNTIVVSANTNAPTQLAFFITPTATIGVPDAFTLKATQGGAVNPAYRGTVTFSSTDPLATFPDGKTYTFTAADSGSHTFTGITFGTAGTFAVNATDGTVTATAMVVVSAVVINPPPNPNTLTFAITPTATIGVPDAFTLSVTQNGVANTAYRGTVTFSSTDPLATFPGTSTYTFTAADNGTHTFATGVVFGSAGTFLVAASDGTVQGTATVVVSPPGTTPPPPVNTFSLTTTPTATVGAADPFTLTVTQNGVPATGYIGTVTFSSTDPLATFPGGTTYTFTAADAGTHTFAAGILFGTVGTFTLHASDGTTSATANVVVSAAGTQPPPTLITPTITLTSSVNPVALNGSTVLTATVTGTQAGGIPTGTVGFFDNGTPLGTVTPNAGIANLPVTFNTTGTHNLTAIYSGSAVYNPVTSAIVVETVGDISLTLTPNTPGTVTVLPGNTATFSFTVTPANNGTFALPVTFSATGLPAGATATFSPASLAAGTVGTAFTLSIAVPANLAALRSAPATAHPVEGGRLNATRLAPAVLALALLPMLGTRRRRKLLLPVLAVLGLTFGALATTGCLTDQASGYFGQQPRSYNIVVTATSGGTTRSASVTLIVQ